MSMVTDSGISTLGPAGLDEAELAATTSAALGVDVDLVGVTCLPVAYSSGSPATAGLWRVDVRADTSVWVRSYSYFVKLLRHVRRWPSLGLIPETARQEFVERFPWRFELDMHDCGIGEVLPEGMRLPVLHRAHRADGDHIGLWWEYVDQRPGPWRLADFARAARLLGRLAARRRDGAEANHRLPEPWRSAPPGTALRYYVRNRVLASCLPMLRDPQLWQHPLLAGALAESGDERLPSDLVDLGERIPRLLDLLDTLPQTFAHGDASPQNLLIPADQPESLVVIDWGFGGRLPIGFDLGQLLVGLAHAGELDADDLPAIDEVIFPAYLDGLMADGMVVEPEVVRLGYRASLVARSALTALPLERLDDPLDDALRAHALDRVRLTRRLVDLAPPS